MSSQGDRVLLICDDPSIRSDLAQAFRSADFGADVTDTVAEGVARLRTGEPNLILLQLDHVGTDSVAGLAAIQGTRSDVPVVVVAKDGGVDACRAAFCAGADDYLLVPIEPDLLVRRAGEVLKARRVRTQADEERLVEKKAESLQTLAGGIAHDLNNQLTVILGSVQEIEEFAASEEDRRECLSAIRRSSTIIAGLAEKLLAYSGGGLFEVEVHDLREVLPGQIQELVWRLLSAMGRTTSVQISAGSAALPVVVDRGQFVKVMEGVLFNALEAIPEGKGEIQVELNGVTIPGRTDGDGGLPPGLSPGDYARIQVTDTGEGMDESTLSRVFEPFFTTKSTGRGLGLAGAQGVIRAHGGAIHVKSRLGQGTQVTFLLPIHKDRAGRRPESVASAPVVDPGSRRPRIDAGRSGRVLIIDDERDVRRMACRILTRAGMQVYDCDGGSAGVDLFRAAEEPWDLVVLDLTMPGMDGVETLAELRRIDPAVRVVLVSGYHYREVTSRFTDERPNAFVQKPFDVNELVNTALEVIGQTPVKAGD